MSKVFGNEKYNCIPERVHKTHLLTNNDKSLYSILCNQAEMKRKNFDMDELNQSELADEVGCSKRTIRRSLTKLENYKLIEIIKNPGFPSEYKILNSDESLIPIEKSQRELRNEKIKAALSKFQNPVPKKEEKEIIKLTPEQTDLKFFIESKIGEKVYNKQIIVLCNAAIENKNIDGNFEIIKSIIEEKCDYIRSKKNKIIKKMMGYIYVAIKKYSPSISENDKSEYHDEALSLSLKLKEEYDTRYHFTLNQCIALFSMASKKITNRSNSNQTIFNFIMSLVSKTISRHDIKDMFAYFRGMIKNYAEAKPENREEPKKIVSETTYSERFLLSISPTYSGNRNGKGIPDTFIENDKTPSYDLSKVKPLFGSC